MREYMYDILKVNYMASNQKQFIDKYEKVFDDKIESTVNTVMSKGERLIMLTGPSSSGKTTTAFKIEKYFREKGIPCATISLDSFFKNKGEIALDEFGKPEFERPDALELPLVTEKLNQLQKSGRAKLPVFDFTAGRRYDDAKEIDLSGGVAVIEGIHALNPIILNDLCTSEVYKLYISVHSGFEKYGEDVIEKRTARFIRRLVRDYKFRNSTAENTYMLWEKVIRDEVEYVLPYKKNANFRIDTTFPYEIGMFKKETEIILGEIEKGSPYYDEANKLIERLSLFESFDKALLPKTSLLCEFCGGGIFKY